MKVKEFAIGPVVGRGSSATQARESAIAQAAAVLSAVDSAESPFLCSWRGESILVFRELHGWVSTSIFGSGHCGEFRFVTLSPTADRSQVIAWAWLHLFQIGWKPEDGCHVPDVAEFHRHDRGGRCAAEFRSWAEWQTRYRSLAGSGFSDDDARRILSGFAAWPSNVADPLAA